MDLKDYIGTQTAIHCETSKEWNKIVEELNKFYNYNKNFDYFHVYKEKSCIFIDSKISYCYQDTDYANSLGTPILKASLFLNKEQNLIYY